MNKKTGSIILVIVGLFIISAGLYIYFVANKIYPASSSSRVQQLNWLLRTFGKLPLTIGITIIGFIFVYKGIKRWRVGNG